MNNIVIYGRCSAEENFNKGSSIETQLLRCKSYITMKGLEGNIIEVIEQVSGTVKFESGNSKVLDLSKAQFIKEEFNNKKIGIFYKFTAELIALKEVFGDTLCTDLEEFNTSKKNIALQIVSGREGISLCQAECLVYYNIDFSATSYWQSRDRMTTKERLKNNIYWVFSNHGIEEDIYKAVARKKDYTLQHFKRDLVTL